MRRSDGPVGRAAAPRPSRRARGPVAPRAAILGDVTDLIAIPLSDGTQILATVKTNAQGVHTIGLECDSSKPGLVLHWGVIRAGYGEEWQLLPPELNPPGTTVYKQKALQLYGSLREKVVTYASTGAEYVRERLPDQVPERQRVIAMAQKGATIVASLGLRVASVAATGSARLQADEESVENAEKLVRDLAEQFDAADARLRADALKLKATWDDLQLQAYDAFVRGEASRADTARAAADGAALSLVHLKHEASQESTD